MRRRVVYLAAVPLYWPLELMADVGHVPSLGFIRVHLALVKAVQFVVATVLFLDHH
jgi:hypothetical protein